jgi:hypothetical protein
LLGAEGAAQALAEARAHVATVPSAADSGGTGPPAPCPPTHKASRPARAAKSVAPAAIAPPLAVLTARQAHAHAATGEAATILGALGVEKTGSRTNGSADDSARHTSGVTVANPPNSAHDAASGSAAANAAQPLAAALRTPFPLPSATPQAMVAASHSTTSASDDAGVVGADALFDAQLSRLRSRMSALSPLASGAAAVAERDAVWRAACALAEARPGRPEPGEAATVVGSMVLQQLDMPAMLLLTALQEWSPLGIRAQEAEPTLRRAFPSGAVGAAAAPTSAALTLTDGSSSSGPPATVVNSAATAATFQLHDVLLKLTVTGLVDRAMLARTTVPKAERPARLATIKMAERTAGLLAEQRANSHHTVVNTTYMRMARTMVYLWADEPTWAAKEVRGIGSESMSANNSLLYVLWRMTAATYLVRSELGEAIEVSGWIRALGSHTEPLAGRWPRHFYTQLIPPPPGTPSNIIPPATVAQALTEAAAHAPTSHDRLACHLQLATLLVVKRSDAEARALLARMADEWPQDGRVKHRLGCLHKRGFRHTVAAKVLTEALADPQVDLLDAAHDLVRCYLSVHMPTAARSVLDDTYGRAASLAPLSNREAARHELLMGLCDREEAYAARKAPAAYGLASAQPLPTLHSAVAHAKKVSSCSSWHVGVAARCRRLRSAR